MIKSVLNAITGVDLYAILSLGLFMTFFVSMLVWVVRLQKPHLTHMQQLPLEQDDTESGGTHHV